MKKSLSDIIRAADGFAPIPSMSGVYNIKAAVQDAMSGRTHYFDDGALAFFSARIVKAATLEDGAVLATICSQAEGFHGGRVYVVRFHDYTGHCLRPNDLDDCSFKTRAAADRYFWARAESLDGRAIVAAAIMRERRAAERKVKSHAAVMRKHRAMFRNVESE